MPNYLFDIPVKIANLVGKGHCLVTTDSQGDIYDPDIARTQGS
jgi:hypothetical protein